MASLLRSNSQDFVQEVPVGQMAQGTPFPPPFRDLKRGKGRLNLPISSTPIRVGGYIYIYITCIHMYIKVLR